MANAKQPLRVGVISGDGIGPEIAKATQYVLEATGIAITWECIDIGEEATKKNDHALPPSTVAQLKAVRNVIKAPLAVNKLQGQISCAQQDGNINTYPSLNNAIRCELGLFVNPRVIKGFRGVSGKYECLDIAIMREITEDVYFGHEHRIGNDVAAEAIKLTTRAAALKVSEYAFKYAQRPRTKACDMLAQSQCPWPH
jgi:isocitrate dehydrogenase (NAD+)